MKETGVGNVKLRKLSMRIDKRQVNVLDFYMGLEWEEEDKPKLEPIVNQMLTSFLTTPENGFSKVNFEMMDKILSRK